MEHRTDLEEILLAGLETGEREHVIRVMYQTSEKKLTRMRARGARDLKREEARRIRLASSSAQPGDLAAWAAGDPDEQFV